MTRLWDPGTPLPQIVRLVLGRYLAHFHPDFLFARGDLYELVRPPGQGEFAWYLLPCMLAGVAVVAVHAKRSRAARVLIALLAAYPAGDVISRYLSVHALRSAPGIPALILLGALGAAGAGSGSGCATARSRSRRRSRSRSRWCSSMGASCGATSASGTGVPRSTTATTRIWSRRCAG
jgi:hypothetical protein